MITIMFRSKVVTKIKAATLYSNERNKKKQKNKKKKEEKNSENHCDTKSRRAA